MHDASSSLCQSSQSKREAVKVVYMCPLSMFDKSSLPCTSDLFYHLLIAEKICLFWNKGRMTVKDLLKHGENGYNVGTHWKIVLCHMQS